jgi:hypothetical protein
MKVRKMQEKLGIGHRGCGRSSFGAAEIDFKGFGELNVVDVHNPLYPTTD